MKDESLKDTCEENMALYIPLGNECIVWVHVHPFTGYVGMHRTSEILQRFLVAWIGTGYCGVCGKL